MKQRVPTRIHRLGFSLLCNSPKKRQRTAALQNLAELGVSLELAKRFGVRQSSAALAFEPVLTGTFSHTAFVGARLPLPSSPGFFPSRTLSLPSTSSSYQSTMSPDFRNEAATATLAALGSPGGGSLADLDQSGCLPMPGGRRLCYLTEIPSLILIMACCISLPVVAILAMLNAISERQAGGIILGGFAIALTFRKLRSIILKGCLTLREGSFLKRFPDFPVRPVSIEDAKTYQKTKLLAEDEGVCVLDAGRRRILIEGCAFRYVIYGSDIYLIEPVSAYALGGARLTCRMGGHQLAMVIKSAGHGPLASLVQAFAPSAQAATLTAILTRTLFGVEARSFNQQTLPPPLPSVTRAGQ